MYYLPTRLLKNDFLSTSFSTASEDAVIEPRTNETLALKVRCSNLSARSREMENISRGPTLGDFDTIHTEGSMQDNTVERLQSTRVQTPISPLY
jgi:hypothetical protein